MAKELVPYDENAVEGDFSPAAMQNIRGEDKVRNGLLIVLQIVVFSFIGLWLFIAFMMAGTMPTDSASFFIEAIFIALYAAIPLFLLLNTIFKRRNGVLSKIVQYVFSIKNICTHCNVQITYSDPWICGNCQTYHWNLLSVHTPIGGCQGCQEKMPPAVQCPRCSKHIVLDRRQYQENQVHLTPRKAARFVGDEKKAIIGEPQEVNPYDGHV